MNRGCYVALAGLLGLLPAAPAFAEGSGSRAAVAAAEHAYQDIDFPLTHELAERALELGGAARAQTARLYVLLGISAAALGNTDEAKQDFVIACAVDPSLKIDKNLSPKIRDPYLEAQGYWGAAAERLSLSARPTSDAGRLLIRLSDPASLVSKVAVRVGLVGAPESAALVIDAAPETRFALPARIKGHDYQYALRALDRFGNVLAERGSDADPELVRQAAPSLEHKRAAGAPARERSYFLPAALAVTGLAAVAAGVVFHLKREQAAREWNGPGCENPGQTRIEQCQGVDARRQSAEHLAIGFYAGGGALLTGGLIALLSGGKGAEPPNQRAGLYGLGCAPEGAGLYCSGRF